MIYNYKYFHDLFDIGWAGWKTPYFKEAQICFERYYKPKGLWQQHPKDPKKYGHIDTNGNWHWSNRANTHPKFCMFLYNECVKTNPNFFSEFGNPMYHKINAKRMWDFLYENFDDYFIPSGKYYSNVKRIFENSWNNGNIAMIAVIIGLLSTFRNISKIEYSFNYGENGDMNGTDMVIFSLDNKQKTIQIKSGKYTETSDKFIISGSPNSLEYTTDWYGYADANDFEELTHLIIFKNENITKDGSIVIVPKENVIYFNRKNMKTPQLLTSIMKECGKKEISLLITQEGDKNSIQLDDKSKVLNINIVDPMDKNFPIQLKSFLQKLK